MATIRWSGEGANVAGARERAFEVDRDGVLIPGLLWTPDSGSGPQPLILMGHGGTGHKRNARMLELGNMFARDYGWCAAAIDAPGHGERGTVGDLAGFAEWWGDGSVVVEAIADWRVTLDMLERLGEVDSARIGYWGMSMGTMLGVPYVASDDRVSVAVLGKAGLTGPIPEQTGVDAEFEECAPQIEVPVLFSVQWDDELFDREGQFELFDLIGSEDKRLLAYPGKHAEYGEETVEMHAEFLERQL
jgi:dienelactone hydrolase